MAKIIEREVDDRRRFHAAPMTTQMQKNSQMFSTVCSH